MAADDLLAQAEANGHKRGEHKEQDGAPDRHKHVKKTIKDHTAALTATYYTFTLSSTRRVGLAPAY
jgi:hypothetical protein